MVIINQGKKVYTTHVILGDLIHKSEGKDVGTQVFPKFVSEVQPLFL